MNDQTIKSDSHDMSWVHDHDFVDRLREEINFLTRMTGLGNRDEVIFNEFYGINHRSTNPMIPMNSDDQGIVFFTRPTLNLCNANLTRVRALSPLMTNEQRSYQSAIRAYLDPLAGFLQQGPGYHRSALVDPQSPFIPLMSNLLTSLTGWPDISVGTYESNEGVHKERWAMIDDTTRLYGTYDLTATFRNIQGDPITLLIYTWILYASEVYLGNILPYPRAIQEDEIDYQTRIYRFLLDPSKRFIQKTAIANACFPYATSIGTQFEYSREAKYQTNNKTVSVPFKVVGIEYNDPIHFKEFNALSIMFNPDLGDSSRNVKMKKLQHHEMQFFNYYGYPLVNLSTSELEWWVYKEDYAELHRYPHLNPFAKPQEE